LRNGSHFACFIASAILNDGLLLPIIMDLSTLLLLPQQQQQQQAQSQRIMNSKRRFYYNRYQSASMNEMEGVDVQ
jgi:hypothetical protein